MHAFDSVLPWDMMAFMFSGLWSLVSLAVYAYVAFCLYTIAKKTNTENPWLAWIPIANIVLAILVVWKIAEARNKPGWLGILLIVPIANLVIFGIIAFAD